jgi:hypothetical protein
MFPNPGVTDLVAYWAMDETSGIRSDSHWISGGDNDLTDNNSCGYRNGKQNYCADFIAANSESLSIVTNASLDIYGDMSLSFGMWVYFDTLTPLTQRLFSKWEESPSKEQYILYTYYDELRFAVHDGTSIYEVHASSFGTLSTDVYYFVCAYYDKDNNTIGIGVNDVWNFNAGPTAGIGQYSPATNVYFGTQADLNKYLDGVLDEAFFYKDRVLTPEEFSWFYNSGNGRQYHHLSSLSNPGVGVLAGYWALDEESGQRSCKLNQIDLTDGNTVGFDKARHGISRNAANFITANGEYLSDGPSIYHDVYGKNSLTLGLWVRPDIIPTGSDSDWIISKWENSPDDRQFILYLYGDGHFYFAVHDGTSIYNVQASGFGSVTAGEWYFLCAYYDKDNDIIGIGVNDVWSIADAPSAGIAFYSPTKSLYFGGNPSYSYYFDGLMDEAFLYTYRSLSSSERSWMYNHGYGRTYEDLVADPAPTVSIDTSGEAVPVYVYNSYLELLGIIDDYYSLTWAERYNIVGDFELELPIYYESNSFIEFGNFIHIKSSDRYMIVENIKPILEEDKQSLLLSGESSESLLKRRILESPMTAMGPSELTIYNLVYDHIINPIDTDRKISLFEDWYPALLTTPFYNEQFDMQTIYKVIETIAKNSGLGFKIIVQEGDFIERKFYFIVYEGVDRSYDQTGNSWVIFSTKFDNVLSSSFYESEQEMITTVLVSAEIKDAVGGDYALALYVWGITDDEPSELDRIETVLETTIDKDVTDPPLTDSNVISIISTRGRELLNANPIRLFEGDFDIQGTFVYGVDFFMGDIVQCIISGKSVKARVVELVRSYSADGIKAYLAMDYML